MSADTLAVTFHPFPNYTQLKSFQPRSIWDMLRGLSVSSALAMAALLWLAPDIGLPLFWGLAVPALPLVFFVAPGLWRNLCPLATSNQLPRMAGISRSATNSTLSKGLAFPLGMLALLALVTARKVVFNGNGTATALLIVGAMLAALIGGLLFKGKSGWCSSICPLLPVQRLYGQTPFVKVPNTLCQTCVGCAKNCYDFNPGTATLADQYDERRAYRSFRRFFAGIFPGFVLAYYLVPTPPTISLNQMVLETLVLMSISLALFHLADMLLQTMVNVAPTLFAATAINIYYWFAAPTLIGTLQHFGLAIDSHFAWLVRVIILAGSLIWLWRSTRAERLFLAHQAHQADKGMLHPTPIVQESLKEFSRLVRPFRRLFPAHAAAPAAPTKASQSNEAGCLRIEPSGKESAVRPGQSLLDAIEACGGEIDSACRSGLCGADPIAIVEGGDQLSPIGDDERATLKRLGCAENTRLACSARLRQGGQVSIELKPHKAGAGRSAAPAQPTVSAPVDPALAAIRRVVIIGNGIAGVTAAEHVRRLHAGCEVHLIGRERHAVYNRMGIAKLITTRSGMQGLHLMPDDWYETQRITQWLNTQVAGIDAKAREVILATGERLPYDRLILANGSASWVPPIGNYGLPGSFTLREADEAMGLRDYVQRHGVRHAVVAGAGLLGLEAAEALVKLGLSVTVLCNTGHILDRQLDRSGGDVLRDLLARQGISIRTAAESAQLHADDEGRLARVELKDGDTLNAGIFLACTGVRPNLELAVSAGLATGRGILVNERMETSVSGIYAAGDVAEHAGQCHGLWAVATEQGEIAAGNALGGNRQWTGFVPSTRLKVSGIDLLSAGHIHAEQADEESLAAGDAASGRYIKLLVAGRRLAGAILIGHPELAAVVSQLVRRRVELGEHLDALRAGRWEALLALDNGAA